MAPSVETNKATFNAALLPSFTPAPESPAPTEPAEPVPSTNRSSPADHSGIEVAKTTPATSPSVPEPFPISCISNRYFVFDPNTISHLRRNHNICGVLIGTIPNLSSQNVFLGVPLQLLPEEARVLVERGVAFVVDEVEGHKWFLGGQAVSTVDDGKDVVKSIKGNGTRMSREERLKWLEECDRQGRARAHAVLHEKRKNTEKVLKEKGLSHKLEDMTSAATPDLAEDTGGDSLLFDAPPAPTRPEAAKDERMLALHHTTPTTSYPPLPVPTLPVSVLPLPKLTSSIANRYPLFRHLHSQGYFQMPGLRFGCHYTVYPGDPLRFHSHFLATGLGWDEEFDLLDIVGGGRLGTGVKKAYLIGGEDPDAEVQGVGGVGNARAFSIEWAGL
ncbi:hypothetical protein BDV96DRAFT_210802 [Lophiotrema nucula]|uniref:tRNA-intron lyase n=1 Tax=Lophiotrema nucula TaxID=690887 RepID=A0A6A5ZNX6_9PLEO|nr:hypothetical protein BDV96DRAFT_210802 [Lophiotrema nucula]